jgi:hypothetical protein
MTFQEAQTEFAKIAQSVGLHLTSAELLQRQKQLQRLLDALPNTPEFDPIASAIAEFSPQLAGELTQAVLTDLQAREASLQELAGLLNRVATQAQADVRTLQFDQPRIVVAALLNSVETLQQIRAAAEAGDITRTAAKAEALLVLLQGIAATIKSA